MQLQMARAGWLEPVALVYLAQRPQDLKASAQIRLLPVTKCELR